MMNSASEEQFEVRRQFLRDDIGSSDLMIQMVETVPNGIMITDASAKIQYVNPAFEKITGYSHLESRGRNPRFLSSGRQKSDFYRELWTKIETEGSWEGQLWNRRKDGSTYSQWLSISEKRSESGEVNHYFAIFSDISELSKKHAELEHSATHDDLTGLPNRALFLDRLQQEIREAQRDERGFAMVFADIDGFKALNDACGHLAGDDALIGISRRWTELLRDADTVSRFGGDEFAVLLRGPCARADAKRVAEKLLVSVRQLEIAQSEGLRLGVSLGISLYPHDGTDAEALVAAADEAMYASKKSGGDCYRFSDKSCASK